ncbi:MAG: SMP-30/gluconolactonase/LRE family protein [Spirochaetia bacterium]|nr:SMP-30/gluconolactonase/LRE family protein [Spirochaetia bacterium]
MSGIHDRVSLEFEENGDRCQDLISEQSSIEQVASGFRFLEGPVWIEEDQTLVFSDIPGNALYTWNAEAGVTMLRQNSYLANGNALDREGHLITCEHATSRVTMTDLGSGAYSVLCDSYDSKALNSPNDVVVSTDGSIYFTDPLPGRQARVGIPRAAELSFQGIYRYDPSGTIQLLDDSFTLPNGLCFSTDERQLFVNDSATGALMVFDVDAAGTLSGRRHFSTLAGTGNGCADGMKIHRSGYLFCTGPGGIHILDHAGERVCLIRTPEVAANLTFNEEQTQLYVAATTSIYRITLSDVTRR